MSWSIHFGKKKAPLRASGIEGLIHEVNGQWAAGKRTGHFVRAKDGLHVVAQDPKARLTTKQHQKNAQWLRTSLQELRHWYGDNAVDFALKRIDQVEGEGKEFDLAILKGAFAGFLDQNPNREKTLALRAKVKLDALDISASVSGLTGGNTDPHAQKTVSFAPEPARLAQEDRVEPLRSRVQDFGILWAKRCLPSGAAEGDKFSKERDDIHQWLNKALDDHPSLAGYTADTLVDELVQARPQKIHELANRLNALNQARNGGDNRQWLHVEIQYVGRVLNDRIRSYLSDLAAAGDLLANRFDTNQTPPQFRLHMAQLGAALCTLAQEHLHEHAWMMEAYQTGAQSQMLGPLKPRVTAPNQLAPLERPAEQARSAGVLEELAEIERKQLEWLGSDEALEDLIASGGVDFDAWLDEQSASHSASANLPPLTEDDLDALLPHAPVGVSEPHQATQAMGAVPENTAVPPKHSLRPRRDGRHKLQASPVTQNAQVPVPRHPGPAVRPGMARRPAKGAAEPRVASKAQRGADKKAGTDFLKHGFVPTDGADHLSSEQRILKNWLDRQLQRISPALPDASRLGQFLQDGEADIKALAAKLHVLEQALAPDDEILAASANLVMVIDAYVTMHHAVASLLAKGYLGYDVSLELRDAMTQAGRKLLNREARRFAAQSSMMKQRRAALGLTAQRVPGANFDLEPHGATEPDEVPVGKAPMSPRSSAQGELNSLLKDLNSRQLRNPNVPPDPAKMPPVDPEMQALFDEIDRGNAP